VSLQPSRPVVLFVDDEPLVHEVASRTLTQAGWDVVAAFDGLEAIEVLHLIRHAPALVITDLRMPRLDGAKLGEWIAGRYPGVPILYISGYVDPLLPPAHGSVRAALAKPFTPEMLLKAIHDLCAPAEPGLANRRTV
jgi:CheY-like chemotaxis protein